MAIGLVLQGIALGMDLTTQGGLPSGLGQGLSALALLLLAIFFALDIAVDGFAFPRELPFWLNAL